MSRGSATRVSLVSLVAMTALAAGAGRAGAAATIGETFPAPSSACGNDQTVLQTGSPNGQYAAPSDGVITSWTFHAGNPAPASLKLKIGRSAGGGSFLIVGESVEKHPSADIANTYADVQIPVRTGDMIGYWTDSTPGFFACGRSAGTEYLFRFRGGDQLPGTTQPYGTESSGFQIDFSARLEPDTDSDTFGDETQDKCVGSAGTFTGCPSTVALDRAKQKGRKPKVKVTATVPGAGTLQAGSVNDASLASASAGTSFKPVSQTITSTNKQQVTLTLKLRKSAKKRLAKKGKLKDRVKVVYTPSGGPAASQTAMVKLKG